MASDPVPQAATLIRAGQLAEARRILLLELKENPANESAWLWLVQTLPDDAKRIAALEQCLRFNPQSQKARNGLNLLRARGSADSSSPRPAEAPSTTEDLPPVPRYVAVQSPDPVPAPVQETAPPPFVPFSPPVQPAPPEEKNKSAGFDLLGSFRDQPADALPEADSDLGIEDIAEIQKPVEPFVGGSSEMFSDLNTGEIPPSVSPQAASAAPLLESNPELEKLRSSSRTRGQFQRVVGGILRVLMIILVGAVVMVAGWFLWGRYGGGVSEWVVAQVISPTPTPQPTPIPGSILPSQTPTPTLTPTPTRTPTPLPPTVTPTPTRIPHPAVDLGMIVFASDLGTIGKLNLFQSPPFGEPAKQITALGNGSVLYPDWSRDGKRLVFVYGRVIGERSDLYVANADGSNPVAITQGEAGYNHPSWSPDGKRIAFSSIKDGNPEIYIMNSDGSNIARLTKSPAADLFPAWSPDGSRIAFVSDRNKSFEIYTLPAPAPGKAGAPTDPAGLVRLTFDNSNARLPAWSADGKSIVYSTDRDGDREIYSMHADGTNQQRLTFSHGVDDEPVWSPDGAWIVFSSERVSTNVPVLFMMRADGSGVYRFDKSDASERSPAWSGLPQK